MTKTQGPRIVDCTHEKALLEESHESDPGDAGYVDKERSKKKRGGGGLPRHSATNIIS